MSELKELSEKKWDWADFFISGFLGVIYAAVGLSILLYISYQLFLDQKK